jgi:O-antigen ligase
MPACCLVLYSIPMGIWQSTILIALLSSLPFISAIFINELACIRLLWIGCIIFSVGIINKIRKKQNVILQTPEYFYLLWVAVLTGSSIFGIHPLTSIIGGSYRYQGVLFFLGLLILQIVVRTLEFRKRKLLISIFAIEIFLESVLVFIQYHFHSYLPYRVMVTGRAIGSFLEPTITAGYLCLGGILVLLFYNAAPGKTSSLLKTVFAVIVAVGIACTGTRIAFVVFIGVALYSFIQTVTHLKLSKNIRRLATCVFTVLILCTVVSFIYRIGLTRSSPYEGRLELWNQSISAIAKRPLFGYGAESGEDVLTRTFENNGIHLWGLVYDRTHNIFLDVMLWSGIFGLITFFAWLGSLLYRSVRAKKWPMIVGLVSFLAYSFFQPVSMIHWVFFIVLLSAV